MAIPGAMAIILYCWVGGVSRILNPMSVWRLTRIPARTKFWWSLWLTRQSASSTKVSIVSRDQTILNETPGHSMNPDGRINLLVCIYQRAKVKWFF